MSFKTITLVVLTGLFIAVIWPENRSANARSAIQTINWQGADFARVEGQDTAVTANGLTLAETAVTGTYLSPTIPSPSPFNAVVPQWLAEVPENASLEIHLRTSKTGAEWSKWYDLHAHDDWNEPGDELLRGDMIAVSAADKTHHFIQFQVSFGRYAPTPPPLLRQLTFVLIDTSAGPTTTELIARQETINAANGLETPTDGFVRPFVISRAAWCSQPECWYSDLAYEPASHLIVHHTVTSSDGDTAAIIRAIWEYHTFSLGWGDIGYNYLIDLNGIIFEGHLNENYEQLDVVGVHSGAANTGSMAASLIGDFRSPDEGGNNMPTPAMLNALADLFAWKANQRGIDLYDASRMVNVSWGLPHITSHRDVYGGLGTLCPGGNLHIYLPWLRDAVATRIGYVSPYLTVDELSSNFTGSATNWYEGPGGCGDNIHSFYTWSTSDPGQSTNWGRWEMDVPQDGRYRLQIYAPYCATGAPETTGARYIINHAYGNSHVTVNQDANVGLWMTLGEFDLAANSDDNLFLTDLTATDNGRGVWFDAVRLLYLGEVVGQANNATPTNGIWVRTAQVDFSWQIFGPNPVLQTRLQVATDLNMNNLILDQMWPGAMLHHSQTFGQGYGQLYWRVAAVTQRSGGDTNTLTSAVTSFGLDALSPTSRVTHVYQIPDRPGYLLHWSGTDDTSGITNYLIEYRLQGDSDWTVLTGIPPLATSASFIPPDGEPEAASGRTYEFRSRATDTAGNAEPAHVTADISTNQAILLAHAIMLPVVKRD